MRDSKTIERERLFGIAARLVRTIPYYRSAFLVASLSDGRSGAHARSRGMVMLQHRSKETLDRGDYGWLKARHHFVVSAKGNRANGPLGALVVWNDDEIAPGTGFGHHTHTDMEIVTYVRQGVVTHEDSAGNVGHTVAGDVQGKRAGRGISHS